MKSFKSVGVKSGYQGFQTVGLRGTIYVPKSFFVTVPEELTIDAIFAEPKAVAPKLDELKATIESLKAQLAAIKVA